MQYSDGIFDEVKELQAIFATKIISIGAALVQKNKEINKQESTQILNVGLMTKLDEYIVKTGSNNLNSEIAKKMLTYLTSTLAEYEKPKKELDFELWTEVRLSLVSNIICLACSPMNPEINIIILI